MLEGRGFWDEKSVTNGFLLWKVLQFYTWAGGGLALTEGLYWGDEGSAKLSVVGHVVLAGQLETLGILNTWLVLPTVCLLKSRPRKLSWHTLKSPVVWWNFRDKVSLEDATCLKQMVRLLQTCAKLGRAIVETTTKVPNPWGADWISQSSRGVVVDTLNEKTWENMPDKQR